MRLGLSHLHDHKFKHNILDTINLLCSCGSDIESTFHFFLYCSNFSEERITLLSDVFGNNSNILTCTDSKIVETLLFGDIYLINLVIMEFLMQQSYLKFHWNDLMTLLFWLGCKKIDNRQYESRVLNSCFNFSS